MLKKAASVFVQTLKNHCVDRFFCVPGESYLSVMDELLYSPGIEVVTCSTKECWLLWQSQMQNVQVKLV